MWHNRLPTVALIVAVAALSLLAAGCGGGSAPGVASVSSSTSPGAAGSSRTASGTNAMLAAGRCLRQNGLTNLPDPTIAAAGPAKGQPILDKQALSSFSESVVNHAVAACNADLERAGISYGSGKRTPQQIQDGLAFARCVRRHGISNFPDPNGQGNFNLAGTGINSHELTPAELAAAKACLPVAHGAINIPQQGNNAGASGQ